MIEKAKLTRVIEKSSLGILLIKDLCSSYQ